MYREWTASNVRDSDVSEMHLDFYRNSFHGTSMTSRSVGKHWQGPVERRRHVTWKGVRLPGQASVVENWGAFICGITVW